MNKTETNEVVVNGVKYVRKDNTKPVYPKVIELTGEESVWEIGKNYLIRTVTMIQLGRLIRVTDKELLLTDACWVADTGRFSVALEKGTLNEVEMFQRYVIVGRGGIIDATEWITELPKTTK